MMEERVKWVDSAKGICVLFVIIGHFLYGSCHKNLNTLIYSFHVPTFFLLSGFVHKGKSDWIGLFRKARKLLIPYFLFNILSIGRALEALRHEEISLTGLIQKLFYFRGEIFFNYPLWFLVVLFEIFLIEFFVNSPVHSIYANYWILLLMVGISFYIYYYDTNGALNIFGVNRTIVAYIFFQAGVILRKSSMKAKIQKHRFKIQNIVVLLFFGTACYVIGTQLNEKTSLYSYSLGNLAHYYLAAFSGIVVLLNVCILFLNKDSWIGQQSKYAVLFLGIQFFISDWYIDLMIQKNLLKTSMYDLGMILIIALFVIVVPLLYKKIKRVFKPIALLNGESW